MTREDRLASYGLKIGHTEAEWLALLDAQDHECYYCRIELTEFNRSRDHRIPLIRGGDDSISNIVAVCRRCNSKKSTMTEAEYKSKLESKKIPRVAVVFQTEIHSETIHPTEVIDSVAHTQTLTSRKAVEREVALFERQYGIAP